jgi:S-phase kinase-associated protein 1
MSTIVKLKSADGVVIEVAKDLAFQSGILKSMIEDAGETDDPIPVDTVKGAVLQKVFEYCEKHKDNPTETVPKPLRSTDLSECGITEWDFKFINLPDAELFPIVLAANFLDLKSLLDLACCHMACTIKNLTPEQIKTRYNLKE